MNDLENDLRVLRACIARIDEQPEDADKPDWYEPFSSMVDDLTASKWPSLTERQRAWVRGVHGRLFDEPQYENLWSSGKVPRGNYGKTPTPEVLQRRPLKPPGGRA